MTKEELAKQLTGREYGNEITEEECAQAVADNLVVVFGASDDLMETFKTKIPHATFEIVEGKEKYCLGIVFSLDDL